MNFLIFLSNTPVADALDNAMRPFVTGAIIFAIVGFAIFLYVFYRKNKF